MINIVQNTPAFPQDWYGEDEIYLGTIEEKHPDRYPGLRDLYFVGGTRPTVIERYGDGGLYGSGLCFSNNPRERGLTFAARIAMEKGLLDIDVWRKAVYSKGYLPYSEVKELVLKFRDKSQEELDDIYEAEYKIDAFNFDARYTLSCRTGVALLFKAYKKYRKES